ncbi:MAG: response regulator [Gemmatimonadaceae bacterium]
MNVTAIIVSGIEPSLATRLRERLDAVVVVEADDPREISAALVGRDFHLLLLGDAPSRPLSLDILRDLRRAGARVPLHVACCLDRDLEGNVSSRVIAELGIDRLFFRPVDPEEVVHQVARLTGTEVIAPKAEPSREEKTASALDVIWERFRDPTLKRVDLLDDAVIALLENRLGEDQRVAAEREAHKLAGSAGTFGFPRSSRIAREIENKLAERRLGQADAVALADRVLALRKDLEGVPQRQEIEQDADPTAEASLVLIVDDDPGFSERLVMEAEGRGLRTLHHETVGGARVALQSANPAAAIVRLRPGDSTETLEFISSLEARNPPVATMVLAESDAFRDRVEVARRGARRFVEAPLPPSDVVDAMVSVIAQSAGQRATVLAVDDDPHILAALRAILEPRGFSLTVLDDPLRFWDVLEAVNPDLLILDMDMPHVSGLELCRVVRSDRRWSGIPVLFLTARTDLASIQRAFASGADDHVGKPIVTSELMMRLNNRLDRARLSRELAETDALTGIANRRKSTELLERFLKLATRKGDPFSVAVLDLDHFKAVNDRFGHAAGDDVLRATAQLLSRSLRSEDVVGRWGGEEFTVGLYGTNKSEGAKRLTAILAGLSAHGFTAPDGSKFQVTCSGGVAQYAVDGADLDSLHRAADAALYSAKAAGRNRVLPAGLAASADTDRFDVVIVDDDEALVGLLEHSLRTRGLTVRSFEDGEEAASALTGDVPAIRAKVVLLDVDLPGLNGLDVLRRLHRAKVTARSKVVMLTARTGEGDVLAALDLGAIDHVTKPFSVPVLLQKVTVALRAAGA